MAFSRTMAPLQVLDERQLTRAMVGIGMRFATRPHPDANIEDTLLFASESGMEGGDLRTLSVLVTWFGVHSNWVNADRLVRLVRAHDSDRVRAFWSAVAHWKSGDRRFSRLIRCHRGRPLDLLTSGTAFQLRRRGEDERFVGSALRVPKGTLRDRPDDVVDPAMLCQRHCAYRHRVMIGPTYRADMWARLVLTPEISAADLARQTYGSFATAWQVRRDFLLVNPR